MSACVLQEGEGRWYNLDADRVVENGEVKGTANPTGDSLLLDCRFELPWGMYFTSLITIITSLAPTLTSIVKRCGDQQL